MLDELFEDVVSPLRFALDLPGIRVTAQAEKEARQTYGTIRDICHVSRDPKAASLLLGELPLQIFSWGPLWPQEVEHLKKTPGVVSSDVPGCGDEKIRTLHPAIDFVRNLCIYISAAIALAPGGTHSLAGHGGRV